jgi:hypothetical protein
LVTASHHANAVSCSSPTALVGIAFVYESSLLEFQSPMEKKRPSLAMGLVAKLTMYLCATRMKSILNGRVYFNFLLPVYGTVKVQISCEIYHILDTYG